MTRDRESDVVSKVAEAIAEAARGANPGECSEVCARAAMRETLRAMKEWSHDYSGGTGDIEAFASYLSISL